MKVPYDLTPAVALDQRHEHMRQALETGLPRLTATPIEDTRTLSVACYGPSLQDTWKDLRPPILSMSGATRWLAERGVIPDYHCDMDPRPHKVAFIEPPIPGVHYLMASVCHPGTWEILKGERITLWHAISDAEATMAWVGEHDPGQLVVHGGSTIGLSALHVGGLLGYRHFEIHGMDGSFSEGARHAGAHTGKVHKDEITWDAGRVTYRTSKIMANAVAETLNMLDSYPIFCVFHGVGLTQALVREAGIENACCADEIDKAAKIRMARAIIAPVAFNPKDMGERSWAPLVAAGSVDLEELRLADAVAETRRARADFNTGSISVEAMLALRGLVRLVAPRVVVEVGTFIGRSTMALLGPSVAQLFTCDRSNDVFPATPRVVSFPRHDATTMFGALDARVRADLVFLDGRLGLPDIPLLLRLLTPETIIAVDDYVGDEKGVANVARLHPFLPHHALVPPSPISGGHLALLVPGHG